MTEIEQLLGLLFYFIYGLLWWYVMDYWVHVGQAQVAFVGCLWRVGDVRVMW